MEKKHNPLTYLKLAQIFLSLGDDDLARATCERGLKHFPNDASLHTQRGNALIISYKKSKKREDLIQAIKSLEMSITINPDNYQALMLSSIIYIKAKAYDRARQKLNMIFSSFPGDPKATELLKLIATDAHASSIPYEGESSYLSIEEQNLKRVEERKQEVELEVDQEIESLEDRISAHYEPLTSSLVLFKKEYGIEMAMLVDKYGMVIKTIHMSKQDYSQYGIAISNIFRSSRNAVQKTGLGVFSKGLLITPQYKIYIVDVKGTILAIFTLHKVDNEAFEKRIDRYIRKIELKWTSNKP